MVAPSPETRFTPQGDLTIRAARTLQIELLELMSGASKIVVDLPDEITADLSFVQTIESARIYAQREKKTLSLASPAKGALLDVLQRGGFIDDMSAGDKQFWLHQGDTQ
jgi:hypothetical protein